MPLLEAIDLEVDVPEGKQQFKSWRGHIVEVALWDE